MFDICNYQVTVDLENLMKIFQIAKKKKDKEKIVNFFTISNILPILINKQNKISGMRCRKVSFIFQYKSLRFSGENLSVQLRL